MARRFVFKFPVDEARLEAERERAVTGFYRRHPSLRRWRPRVLATWGGGGESRSHPEASYDGRVLLGPKFWAFDTPGRDWILAHELGHHVESTIGLSGLIEAMAALGLDAWDTAALPFGQFRMDEAFAEAFAAAHLDPHDLWRRYPRWADLVEAISARVPT